MWPRHIRARHVECFMRSRSIHAEKSKAIHIPPGHMPVRMSTLSVRSTAQRIAPRVHVPRELSVVLTPNRNDTYLYERGYIFSCHANVNEIKRKPRRLDRINRVHDTTQRYSGQAHQMP